MKNNSDAIIKIKKPSEINLSSIIQDSAKKTFLMTAANAGSGVTSSSLSLAEELSKIAAGSVLIIDTSISKDNLTTMLGKETALGLTDIETNQETINIVDYLYKFNNFYLMPCGRNSRKIQETINKDINKILKTLSSKFRFIILDGDAIYGNVNAIDLASKVDGVILVIQAEETRWEVALAAQKRLKQAGADIIGCVFNDRKYYTPSWIYNKL